MLSANAVAAKLDISRSTFWRMRNEDRGFPKAKQIRKGVYRWRESDVDRWITRKGR